MGKIIILTGPQSSGKTSLLSAVINFKMMNFFTIPRKQIMMKSIISLGEKECFKDLMDEISVVMNRRVSLFEAAISDHLFEIELRHNIKRCLKEHAAELDYMIYASYAEESRKLINSGHNVIIDDTLLYFDFDKFRYHISALEVRIVLLYDNLEGLLSKCSIRNEKFLQALQQVEDVKKFQMASIKKDFESNDSRESLRFPIAIVKDYMAFYKFLKIF